jgi:subtilase family serine protease
LGTYSSGVLSGGISFDGLKGDGSGQTIAIVDPYDDPGLVSSTAPNFSTSDLAVFDAAMHLPDPPSFQKVNEYGNASPLPAASGSSGWSLEESLDVEWAHAMAPKAAIILFETEDFPHVTTGVNSAENTAGVVAVSMSWAVPEFSAESQSQYDSLYTTPTNHYGGNNGVGGSNLPGGVTFLAASGDYGVYGLGGTTIGRLYPAVSPNVVAVGGTTLTVSGSDPN